MNCLFDNNLLNDFKKKKYLGVEHLLIISERGYDKNIFELQKEKTK